jgi:hypothetical protein
VGDVHFTLLDVQEARDYQQYRELLRRLDLWVTPNV